MRRLDDRDSIDPYNDRYDDLDHNCDYRADLDDRVGSYLDGYTFREKTIGYLRFALFIALVLGVATACVNWTS